MKLLGVVLGMMAVFSPIVKAQEAAPTLHFSAALRAVEDTAVVFPKLRQWQMTVRVRYELTMALEGRADLMPPYPLDSLRMLRDSLGVLEYAEWDRTTKPTSRDPNATGFWHLDSLRVERPWALGIDGSGVVASILDTGFWITHPEFTGRVESCVRFNQAVIDTISVNACAQTLADCNSHGQHVASLTGGATRGVAPQARLRFVNIFEDVNGDCLAWASARIMALRYETAHGTDVVNFSTGSGSGLGSELLAVNAAYAAGVVVVGASGNNSGYQALYPGAFPHAVSIGALTSSLSRASYSNRDTLDLDFACPGSSVSGAIGATGYGGKSGTSMASPVCAGVFVLLTQACPACGVDSLYALAKASSKDLGATGHDPSYGWGLPRADRGVALALGLSLQPLAATGSLTVRRGDTGCVPVDSPVEWSFTGTVPGVTMTPAPCGLHYTVALDAPFTEGDPPIVTLSVVP